MLPPGNKEIELYVYTRTCRVYIREYNLDDIAVVRIEFRTFVSELLASLHEELSHCT